MSSLFFYNGNILTMNKNNNVEAVVVKDDKIVFTGTYEQGLNFTDTDTTYIDLKKRTLLPGFNDSHMHLVSYGLSKYKVDLREADSIEELQGMLKRFIANEKLRIFNDWILGMGWNQQKFKEKRLPTKEDIDKIINDRPVFLSRACYHICVVNSKALELAGITKDTEDPDGGKIDRDPTTGEPTGILRENAVNLVYNRIPFTENVNEIKRLITESIYDANCVGITSIQTDDFFHLKNYCKIIDAYSQLHNEGKLNARINLQMLFSDKDSLKSFLTSGIKTGDGNEWIRFGPLKILADGSLGSRTAALEKPYSDDFSTRGILIYKDKELEEILELAFTNGLQLAVHAIGDRCMNQVLRIYEKLIAKHPKKDPRFRIIHCQICSEDIIKKFKKLDVIADIQPIFIRTDMYMALDRVGSERIRWSYPWKTMLDNGIRVSGSSDCPVEPFNPLLGIYTAVTRQDLEGNPQGGWYPEEKIEVEEAIRLYTHNPAFDTYEEDIKGMIQEGMLADLVVLSQDIMKTPISTIKDIKVDLTVVGGKVVFSRNE